MYRDLKGYLLTTLHTALILPLKFRQRSFLINHGLLSSR